MTPFTKLLATAKIARNGAQELLDRINAGTADLEPGVDRTQAVELLNGTIDDYNQIIRRLAGSKYA